jgi:hypothetical protein
MGEEVYIWQQFGTVLADMPTASKGKEFYAV